MDALAELGSLGGVASGKRLRAAGVGQDRLDRAVRSGRIIRLRRDWFALAGVDPAVLRAVEGGGALSCVSVLQRHGLWVAPFQGLHVRVPAHGHRPHISGVVAHGASEPVLDPVDDLSTALRLAADCLPTRDAVIAFDSALSLGIAGSDDVAIALAGARSGPRLTGLIDGRSESGLETIARLAVRSRRIQAKPQFRVPGIGRVDLLIGDRLVLELDGRSFHSGADFDRDRERDLLLTARGYLVIRASYRQVMFEWDVVERHILGLVRRREHLWRASARALGQTPRRYRG
jgi:very-short-patch-repair endonuclease